MIWTLVIVMLSASTGISDYRTQKVEAMSFPSQSDCQPIMESYNAANQTFMQKNGPPWMYSYAVCEEGNK